jgi:hypothetical protein
MPRRIAENRAMMSLDEALRIVWQLATVAAAAAVVWATWNWTTER